MKKIFGLLCVCFMFLVSACTCTKDDGNDNLIEYTHYANGGVSESLKATLLWKYTTSAFTKYQVAYTSYVCSDPSVNYVNIIYIELTNKGTKGESVIRNISFTTTEESNGDVFNVGLWGDYKESYGKEFYTGIEEELLSKLKYMNYEKIYNLAEKGYKNYTNIDGIDNDVISGGTVSASNVVSIVKSIFDYHLKTQY